MEDLLQKFKSTLPFSRSAQGSSIPAGPPSISRPFQGSSIPVGPPSIARLPPYKPADLPPIPTEQHASALSQLPIDKTSSPGPESARTGTIPTRILLLSDTHNTALFPPNDARHAFKAPLPRADVLVHAGDLSNAGTLRQLEVTFQVLKSAPAKLKLVIAGNHDLSLDAPYYRAKRSQRDRRLGAGRAQRSGGSGSGAGGVVSTGGASRNTGTRTENWSGGGAEADATVADPAPPSRDQQAAAERQATEDEIARVRERWTGAEARAAGIRYLEEGVHVFGLENGAELRVYASPYSCDYGDWAFMYPRSHDRFNPPSSSPPPSSSSSHPFSSKFRSRSGSASPSPSFTAPHPIPSHPAIDLVLTHGPPLHILDRVAASSHVGCEHLTRALARVRPRLAVFGHIHEDWGAMRVDWAHGTGAMLEQWDGEAWEDVVARGWVGADVTGGSGRGKVRKGRARAGDEGEGGAREETRVEEGEHQTDKEGVQETEAGMLRVPELEWGAETLCVNAAIMDARFRALNAPWVVDLLLPAREGEDGGGG